MSDEPMQPGRPDLAPGDTASEETPNVGEDLCPRCGGDGRLEGRECPHCGGTGTVTEPVGGG